tara:strand:+ start:430 stop:1746 length:1317 start_codon:yes stop_codon:yes gene_type:complete
MANKSFGTKQLDLTGASGSPIITSPSDLSINATTVAISTNISVGGYFASNVNVGTGYSVGIGTTIPIAKLDVRGEVWIGGSSEPVLRWRDGSNEYATARITDGDLNFETRESGTDYERLRITSAGKVGIGTTIPQQQLTVENDATHCLVRVISNSLNESGIDFGDTDDGDQGKVRYNNADSYMRFESGATEKLRITGTTDTTFAGSDDIILNQGGGIAETTQVTGTINMGTSYLNTGHTNGSGHYGAVKFHLYKNPTGTNAETIDNVYGFGISNGMMEIQSNAFLGFFVGSAGAGTGTRPKRMVIDTNGSIGAPSGTNIYSASDSRLKKNVVTLDKGLSEINSLRPVSFNWIDGYCDTETDTLYGFVAQEVQTVDSNLVHSFSSTPIGIGTDPLNPTQTITDPLRVDEKYIVPMLVKAIQELSAKNDALEARIAALEG